MHRYPQPLELLRVPARDLQGNVGAFTDKAFLLFCLIPKTGIKVDLLGGHIVGQPRLSNLHLMQAGETFLNGVFFLALANLRRKAQPPAGAPHHTVNGETFSFVNMVDFPSHLGHLGVGARKINDPLPVGEQRRQHRNGLPKARRGFK